MATQYDPIAKDESLNTTELTPRNIADVLAEELARIVTALGGGSLEDLNDVTITTPSNGQTLKYNSTTQKWENANDAGGHTIYDADEQAMTQRAGLGFTDAHVSDNSGDDRTDVSLVQSITDANWALLDPTDASNNGFYQIGNSPLLHLGYVGNGEKKDFDAGAQSDYVEVVADGIKTYSALLDELFALVDFDRVNQKSCVAIHFQYGDEFQFVASFSTSGIYTGNSNVNANGINNGGLCILASGSTYYLYRNGSNSNASSLKLNNSGYIRLYYNDAHTFDFNTKAENCILNDGGNVEDAVKTITAKPSDIFTPESGILIHDDTIQQIKIGRMVQLMFSVKQQNNADFVFSNARTKLGTLASGWRPTSYIMTPTSGSDSPNSYTNQLVANLVIVPTDGSVNIDKASNVSSFSPKLEQIYITVCYIGEE